MCIRLQHNRLFSISAQNWFGKLVDRVSRAVPYDAGMRDVVFGQVYRHAESTGLLDEETDAGASQQTVAK